MAYWLERFGIQKEKEGYNCLGDALGERRTRRVQTVRRVSSVCERALRSTRGLGREQWHRARRGKVRSGCTSLSRVVRRDSDHSTYSDQCELTGDAQDEVSIFYPLTSIQVASMARLDRAVLSQPLPCFYLTSRSPARDGPQMQLIQRDSFVSAFMTAV
eukprot:scaffold5878_cov47-Phaeocystis_antarctica.AAC.4